MSRPFALLSLVLTAMTAFMIGLVFSGWSGWAAAIGWRPPVAIETIPQASVAEPAPIGATEATAVPAPVPAKHVTLAPGLVNFADVAERINPAVVNIERHGSNGNRGRRRREQTDPNRRVLRPSGLNPAAVSHDGDGQSDEL